ncbi:HD domain-containing protein [Paradevosia shaoguanensis]|nr:HD domain-containing protein [Paradevosia shaoguanensis]
MEIVRAHVDQQSKEERALAAALLHDLGHGPFSHAFEKVGKRLGLKLADHEVMSDRLIRNSEVSEVLTQLGSGFANDVADIIQKGGVKSVHHAVVSSQFDADRLDYVRRDRLMTGTQHAAIDFNWLLANLEIGRVSEGVDETPVGEVETFVLGPKAVEAAEGYVLGLFHLYPTVYLHKATRGMEMLFTELLVQVVSLVREGSIKKTGLPSSHPLIQFAKRPEEIDVALNLDDTIVWGALSQMCQAEDKLVSMLSSRIRDRKLYKCCDVRAEVTHAFDPKSTEAPNLKDQIDRCCAAIKEALTEWSAKNSSLGPRVLLDEDKRSPYKSIGESKGPLDRINIRTPGGTLVDLGERSTVVRSLQTYKLFRAYTDRNDHDAIENISKITKGEIEKCRQSR